MVIALKRGSSMGVSTTPSALTAPSRSSSSSKVRQSSSMTGAAGASADTAALPPPEEDLMSLPLSEAGAAAACLGTMAACAGGGWEAHLVPAGWAGVRDRPPDRLHLAPLPHGDACALHRREDASGGELTETTTSRATGRDAHPPIAGCGEVPGRSRWRLQSLVGLCQVRLGPSRGAQPQGVSLVMAGRCVRSAQTGLSPGLKAEGGIVSCESHAGCRGCASAGTACCCGRALLWPPHNLPSRLERTGEGKCIPNGVGGSGRRPPWPSA